MFILKLSYSKPFHNTLNYASTANIEEIMKFYNLGHKTFETDFNSQHSAAYRVYQGVCIEFLILKQPLISHKIGRFSEL